MAETKDKKPRTPRKPKAEQPAVINPENQENLEKFDEILPDTVNQAFDPSVDPEKAIQEMIDANPEIVEAQGLAPEEDFTLTSESEEPTLNISPEAEEAIEAAVAVAQPVADFATLPGQAAFIKKLNPNLADDRSKWVAQVPYVKHCTHVLFKGSYAKALQAANNYNKSRNLNVPAQQIRSK